MPSLAFLKLCRSVASALFSARPCALQRGVVGGIQTALLGGLKPDSSELLSRFSAHIRVRSSGWG